MATVTSSKTSVDPKTRVGDLLRRTTSLVLAAVGVLVFLLGVRGFARVTTAAFNWAGYIALPLGIFAVMIFLLPLNACVHRLWVAGDAELRRKRLERHARDEALARLSTAQLKPLRRSERSDWGDADRVDLYPVPIDGESRPPSFATAAARGDRLGPRAELPAKTGTNGVKYETPPWFAALVLLVSMTGTVLYLGNPSNPIIALAVVVWVATGIGLATAG